MVTLRLLGGATLDSEAGPIAARALQRRRIALLALLAAARKPVSREKVTAFLWPESDSEQARHLLSVAVYELRKAIHEEAIISARDEVALNPAFIHSDVDEFENAVTAGDLGRAVELYRGPFLDGFHINEAPEFERWVDGERDRLSRAYARALEELAHQHSASGDTAAAVAALRKLAAHDPYSGRIAAMLMLALEANGRRAEALQHARTHTTLMREEFGADADPEIEQLAERLRREPRESVVSTPVKAPAPASATRPPLEIHIPKRTVILPAALTAFATVVAIVVFVWWNSRENGGPGEANAGDPPPPASVTIAVLPFRDLTVPTGSSFFTDGLTDEIINALSSEPSLTVVSRTSTFLVRDPVDLRKLGRELGVSYFLHGTVRSGAERLKVTARLIDAKTQRIKWNNSYDRRLAMADLLSIQENIAQSVVAQLSAKLSPRPANLPFVARTTDDVAAFNLFVTGRHYLHRRTVADMQRALAFFNQAIEQDSNYAPPYAHKAEVLALLGAFDYGAVPPALAFPAARAAAERALQLDPNDAEAHTALGGVLFNYDRDWQAAEKQYQTAIKLNHGNPTAHHWYSLLLHATGRRSDARDEIKLARMLDPASSVTATGMARYYYFAREFPNAIAQYQRALEVDSGFVTAHVGLGVTQAAAGNYSAAVRQFGEAARWLKADPPILHALRTYAYGRSGNQEEARKHRKMLAATSGAMFVPAEITAVADIGVGDYDAAFASLNRALDERSGGVNYLRIDPLVDPIRNDPRFTALINRVFTKKP